MGRNLPEIGGGEAGRPPADLEIPDLIFMVLDVMNANPFQAIGVAAFALYMLLLVLFLQRNKWRIDENPEVQWHLKQLKKEDEDFEAENREIRKEIKSDRRQTLRK